MPASNKPYLLWFKDIHFEDVPIVGGKGGNLGEMYNIGIPVPNGFCTTIHAYFKFIEANDLKKKIKILLDSVNVDDTRDLTQTSAKIRKLIKSSPVPEDIAREIMLAYKRLGSFGGLQDVPVAVRTSATAEDSADASFAGQGDTFLNVVGETNVVDQVRACWSSLFTSRSLFYQVKNHYDHFKIGVAVPVQKMVQSEVSGICFTLNPVSNNKSEIVVETIWGLGEYIVQGIITPDQYIIDKNNWQIKLENHVPQKIQLSRFGDTNKEITVPKYKQNKSKIDRSMAVKVAKLAQKLQNHYGRPQDIEFAIEKGKLYFVQTRPITTVATSQKTLDTQNKIASDTPTLLTGQAASPGIGAGVAIIIKDPKELPRVQAGQVLVTDMTTPDFVPAMKKVKAIVTNQGGQTSHAAIVSRELGVPCVVGTATATKSIKEGDLITVDGTTGKIYTGDLSSPEAKIKVTTSHQKTATKLYVNLGEPELAKDISKRNVDGIGLLRAEFMIANIGIHPKRMIQEGRQKEYIKKLAEGMKQFCQSFNPRPVIYRATDFKTNEYRYLKWGKYYEPEEPNPLLGFRGAYRYLHSPDVFNMELQAIKEVRNRYNLKNLWLMIPFCRSPQELIQVKKLITDAGLLRSPSFKLFMMAEIPSNVILLDKFIDVGIDGISIGSNDLTMLVLGLDRDNSEVAPDFNELDPAVLWSLKRLVTKSKKRGIMVGICGQAPSNHPDLVEKLVKWGITSISVSPDAIDRTREIIAWAEKKKLR